MKKRNEKRMMQPVFAGGDVALPWRDAAGQVSPLPPEEALT